MEKKRVAVLFGGCSPEHSVSLESAASVIRHMDPEKMIPVPVGITRSGGWFYYPGETQKIQDGTWREDPGCVPALLSPRRGDPALMVFRENVIEQVRIDAVFPVLHGKNGEDGTVQGLCQLAGIPVAGCGMLSSALCMDKDMTHRLARLAGVKVPRSFVLEEGYDQALALEQAKDLGYPLFVKPVQAGSSYGVSRVQGPEELLPAIQEALRYDRRVLAEEAISGFETGCAVMGGNVLITGEADEIQLEGGWFDYQEKYHLITSRIHVPARIPQETSEELKRTAKTVYRALGCRGFARVDMFLTPSGEIYLNEVNSMPGFTAHSRFPRMMEAAGIPLKEVITQAVEMAVAE